MFRILRDFWDDVMESPLVMVVGVGFFLLLQVGAIKVGTKIRTYLDDMHVVAEEIRNSNLEGYHAIAESVERIENSGPPAGADETI